MVTVALCEQENPVLNQEQLSTTTYHVVSGNVYVKNMLYYDFFVVAYNKNMTSFKKLTVKETIFIL